MTGRIVVGLLLGVVAGTFLGPSAGPLAEFGKLVITAIKLAAAPLLMLTVVNAVLTTEISGRDGGRMGVFALINATIALCFGLAVSNLLQPGHHLSAIAAPAGGAAAYGKLELGRFLSNFVPPNLAQPFIDNAVLPMVVMSVLLGLALRKLKDAGEPLGPIETALTAFQKAVELILGWIIVLTPFAVFAVVAKAVGEYGLAPLKGLAWYVAAGLIGMALHSLITYQLWLKFYARLPLGRFWRAAKEPMVYSIGANSSLATLPLTLRSLGDLGVSKASSTLGACVGTNLNNDGIILYEAMAVLFVAQAHGLELGLAQQVSAALACLVAAMGIAGVPEAGFVSLSLVLATVGLPVELLPLLLTVDWILARARSVVNVLGDMMVSILLDRAAGKRFS
ncbi:MAG: dicarboxylate/amino acid:cation symporter [Elusimicrobiota bacterium]|nr:dicarboxylate/amino acid:cation symporter [Elusimicrobiota bacterium]